MNEADNNVGRRRNSRLSWRAFDRENKYCDHRERVFQSLFPIGDFSHTDMHFRERWITPNTLDTVKRGDFGTGAVTMVQHYFSNLKFYSGRTYLLSSRKTVSH